MLKHDFISINKEEIPSDITYDFMNSNQMLSISDKLIQSIIQCFDGISSYWDSLDNPQKRLSYWGITIFAPENSAILVNKLKLFLVNYEKNKEIDLLIEFFSKAIDSNLYVIHYGV